jgi:gluconolactonase
MAIETHEPSSTCGKVSFVKYKETFVKAIGSNPHARLLLRTRDGQQLFHEAGIYLPDAETVVLSSNRMYAPCGQQSIRVVHLPLNAIPMRDRKEKQLSDTSSLTPSQQDQLWSQLVVRKDLPSPLVMPNGASRWRHVDGRQGMLWCEQGRHNMTARSGCSSDVRSTLVSYDLDGHYNVELDSFQGKHFSSLNDAVLHDATGAIFFTDPDYGVEQLYKRCWTQESYAPNGVYCWQPRTGQVQLLDTDFSKREYEYAGMEVLD